MLTEAYAIFASARTYWQDARYPDHLSYTVVERVTIKGEPNSAHYHAYYDALSDEVKVVPVSDEELAHPYTPHGIKTGLNLFSATIPLSTAEYTHDYLGVPVLAPNYSFGIARYVPQTSQIDSAQLVQEIREQFKDPMPTARAARESDGSLKTIASIQVARRDYAITLRGIEGLNGHSDYHLQLRPLRDPTRYRLREMWVNSSTFATDKIRIQGNFNGRDPSGGLDQPARIPWTVEFVQIHKAPYIDNEEAQSPVVEGSLTSGAREYTQASVSFENIHAAQLPPFSALMNVTEVPFALTEPPT